MPAIKNIIFDYGNVIFSIDFKRAQKAFTALGVDNAEQFFGHLNQTSFFDDFDKGKLDAGGFRNEIRNASGRLDLTDQQIDNAWNALLIGVPEGTHELLLKLKDNYQTFLLSNNNEIHYKYIMDYLAKEYNLNGNASFFVKDYYSHLLGMRKPDSEIFEFVLKTHHLKPEETLFIDDSPQHIASASALGISSELLTAPDTLDKLLYRRNIIV